MSSTEIRILSATDVEQALSMPDAIDGMAEAFSQLALGTASVPLRTPLPLSAHNGDSLFMPVYSTESGLFGLKVVSLLNDNPSRGLPFIQATVLIFDATNGTAKALMDGEVLTALRTGAGGGLATRLLAREDSQVAAIFGAGPQAATQLAAVCCERSIERVMIFGRNTAKAAAFAAQMSERLGIDVAVETDHARLAEADIICTATTSDTPVFEHRHLKDGVHINAVGTYKPHTREIPEATVLNSRIVVDQRSACLAEAGELVMPIEAGVLQESDIYAELGEIAAGKLPGRQSASEITLFKSVGNAVQDLIAAQIVLRNAEKLELGTIAQL